MRNSFFPKWAIVNRGSLPWRSFVVLWISVLLLWVILISAIDSIANEPVPVVGRSLALVVLSAKTLHKRDLQNSDS